MPTPQTTAVVPAREYPAAVASVPSTDPTNRAMSGLMTYGVAGVISSANSGGAWNASTVMRWNAGSSSAART